MFAKISRKGQVTIPKPIRERLELGTEGGVLFLVEDNVVKLKGVSGLPARNLAGSLKKYAEAYVPLNTIREKIKEGVANEVACEGLPD